MTKQLDILSTGIKRLKYELFKRL